MPIGGRRRDIMRPPPLCVYNHRYRSSWVERIYKYNAHLSYTHLTKNQKETKKKDWQKSYIEPRIYGYLSVYFNDLIHNIMEDENITWEDDQWFPDSEI